jgi:hypothetical protein
MVYVRDFNMALNNRHIEKAMGCRCLEQSMAANMTQLTFLDSTQQQNTGLFKYTMGYLPT